MGLCTADVRRRRPFKTIIIPRGIINPNEHNIIEIPISLDAMSSLIVKAPSDLNSSFSVEPYRGDIANLPTPAEISPLLTSYQPPGEEERIAPFPDTFSTIRNNVPSEYGDKDRPNRMKVDSSCQTQVMSGSPQQPTYGIPGFQQPPPLCQKPSCGMSGLQHSTPSPYGQRSFYQQSRMQQDAHSPLCPICSKASCKYLSNAGLSHSYTSKLSQFSSPGYPCQTDSCPNPPTYGDSFRFSFLPGGQSEILSKSRERIENEMLSKMLDEKLEKILKPVLFSLAKDSAEDDESEINPSCVGTSVCPAKCSYTSQSKIFREQPGSSRKYEPAYDESRMRGSPSSEASTSKRDVSFELDDFKRDMRKKDSESYNLDTSGRSGRSTSTRYSNVVVTGGNMMRPLPSNLDNYDEPKRRSFSPDRDYNPACPPTSSCQRRGNVSFNERSNRSGLHDKSINLNSSFDGSESSYSLTPRSSF